MVNYHQFKTGITHKFQVGGSWNPNQPAQLSIPSGQGISAPPLYSDVKSTAAIEGAQNWQRSQHPVSLPAVNVYGTKDKQTNDFLNAITHKTVYTHPDGITQPQVTPGNFNTNYYNNVWDSWTENGKPTIRPRNITPDAISQDNQRSYYNHNNNTMYLGYKEHGNGNDWWTPTNNYFGELAHAQQVQQGAYDSLNNNTRRVYQSTGLPLPDDIYDNPRSIEYDAHTIRAPRLELKYNQSQYPSSAITYDADGNAYLNGKFYAKNPLHKQMGGYMYCPDYSFLQY